MLGQFTKTGQLQDSKRPQETLHDFTAVSARDNKFNLNSERFQTRIRGKNVRLYLI
jgi:hypothetical protein